MDKSFVDRLRRAVGRGNVLTDPASLLVYSYDAATDKALPGAVVKPHDTNEVAAVVRLAAEAGVPFVARGAGTNLCGGSIPADGGLVIHLSGLNRILRIDPIGRRALVEAGVVNLHLQNALAPHGLFYAPDPASQKACTLGGNAATNAGGPHCLKYGVTSHHVLGLELVLPDGRVVNTSVADGGYDLTGLFIGSEGTLGIITRMEVRLLPLPEAVQTLLASFPSLEDAVRAVTAIVSAGIVPSTLEVMDGVTLRAVEAFVHAGYPVEAGAVLLVELDGPAARIAEDSARVREFVRRNRGGDVREARDEGERQKLWEGRRGSYPAMARLAPNVLVEDGVVPRTRLPEAVRRIRAVADRENLRMGLIAHAGDGNLHPNIVFDERDRAQTERVRAAGHEMMRVCVELGGSISGEHGIGLDKREAMRRLFTPETLEVFRALKDAFDPRRLCNPDKIVPPPAAAGEEKSEAPSPVDLPDNGVLSAESVPRVRSLLASACAAGRKVVLCGSGRSAGPTDGDVLALRLDGLTGVVEHDRDNFTLTVRAGMPLKDVRAYLTPFGQYLHLSGEGTLGGVLSSCPAGKESVRDQIIGLKAVLADGRLVSFGGKVIKNVAGYDAAKLFIGAWGTLGAVVEVTLRLFPSPALEKIPSAPAEDFSWMASPLHRRVKQAFDPAGVLLPPPGRGATK